MEAAEVADVLSRLENIGVVGHRVRRLLRAIMA
jgi:hypothetical protein